MVSNTRRCPSLRMSTDSLGGRRAPIMRRTFAWGDAPCWSIFRGECMCAAICAVRSPRRIACTVYIVRALRDICGVVNGVGVASELI